MLQCGHPVPWSLPLGELATPVPSMLCISREFLQTPKTLRIPREPCGQDSWPGLCPLPCREVPASLGAAWLLALGLSSRLAISQSRLRHPPWSLLHLSVGAQPAAVAVPGSAVCHLPACPLSCPASSSGSRSSTGSFVLANRCNYPWLKSLRDREVRAAGGGQQLPARRFRPAVNLLSHGWCSTRHQPVSDPLPAPLPAGLVMAGSIACWTQRPPATAQGAGRPSCSPWQRWGSLGSPCAKQPPSPGSSASSPRGAAAACPGDGCQFGRQLPLGAWARGLD